MDTKTTIALVLKVVLLTFLLFVCFSAAWLVVGLEDLGQTAQTAQDRSPKPHDTVVPLLIMCLFFTIVLSYPIVRSRWSGWRLVLTTFLVYYGITTFLPQIETVVFLNHLVDIVSSEQIPGLFMQGAVVAALFSPLAVFIHGKMRTADESQEINIRLVMPWTEWVWKLILIAVAYAVIYFSFGIFVFMPLAGDAFQAYYGDLQPPAWILPLQMVRGLIWAAIALPVIRMMKGRWWEAGLAVALLFSVLMGFLLLLPNQFMPDAIRRAHFVEVSSSNFVFGWFVAWLLNRHHRSPGELFKGSEQTV